MPRIALIQLHVPAKCTPSEQFERMKPLVLQAAAEQADLVVLPEMALGLPPRDPESMVGFADECATQLSNLQSLAQSLSVNLVPGSLCEHEDGKFFNTTYFIDRQGVVQQRYRKVNLWGDERKNFSPGLEHKVLHTPDLGPIGLLVCWDLAFPEAFRCLIKQGARMVIIPTLWRRPDCGEKGLTYNPDSEETFINSIIVARAFEQNCAVAFCNSGGDGDEYFGASQVALPFKGGVGRLDGKEQVGVIDVDLDDILEEAEKVWNIREDVASPGWYRAG